MKSVVSTFQPKPSLGRSKRPGALTSDRSPFQTAADAGTTDQLCDMRRAFCSTGGLTSGDALAVLMRGRFDQPLSVLARWIVDRQVVSFEVCGDTWLPVFQFNLDDMSLRTGLNQVIGELREVFDDWELAAWFATPNCWLAGLAPALCLASEPSTVIDAARADRFVAAG